jgi:hypothetical protein
MTLCRETTLVKSAGHEVYAKPLKCRSWSCEYCRPERKSQLCARAASGIPTRFVTLTSNPALRLTPEEQLRLLSKSWRLFVQTYRREHGPDSLEYLAIAEETKAGWPHLHILVRGSFIPQKVLSAWMASHASAPIVDVRSVKNVHEAVSYVAKYIAKAPKQFGNAKRYWSTSNYEIQDDAYQPVVPLPEVPWALDFRSLEQLIRDWCNTGIAGRRWHKDILIGIPIDPRPPW